MAEAKASELASALFTPVFGSSSEAASTQTSSSWSGGLKALLAPTEHVAKVATSAGELIEKAAQLQKELSIQYPPEAYAAVATNHGNGNTHLIQRYIETAAAFISVNAECYNKVSRSSTNLGFAYGNLVLGVKDSRMSESQQLVGIITAGNFFFVKTHCVVSFIFH